MAPRLYAALGLEESATPADIKKAYHAKALTCHPDKVGPAGEAEFKRINEAHAVLSDPQKRAIYDAQGERGLEFINNEFVSPLRDELGIHVFMLALAMFLLLTSICTVTVVACVASKLDGHIGSPWSTTLTALWIWDAVIALVGLQAAYVLIKRKVKGDAHVTPQHFVFSLGIFLVILWHALVVHNLDQNGASMKWATSMLPVLLLCVISFFSSLRTFTPAYARQSLEASGIAQYNSFDVAWIVFQNLVNQTWFFLTLLLIGEQADGALGSASWGVSAIPVFIKIILYILNSWVTAWLVKRNGMIDSIDNLCQRTFVPVLQNVLPTATIIMCVMRADQGEDFATVGDCVAPVLIQLCLLMIGAWTLTCYSTSLVLGDVNRPGGEQPSAEPAPAATAAAAAPAPIVPTERHEV